MEFARKLKTTNSKGLEGSEITQQALPPEIAFDDFQNASINAKERRKRLGRLSLVICKFVSPVVVVFLLSKIKTFRDQQRHTSTRMPSFLEMECRKAEMTPNKLTSTKWTRVQLSNDSD
jgi:hypothetical protein